METATVEVRFQKLSIAANIQLGNRALPTVLNSYRDFVEVAHVLAWHTCIQKAFRRHCVDCW